MHIIMFRKGCSYYDSIINVDEREIPKYIINLWDLNPKTVLILLPLKDCRIDNHALINRNLYAIVTLSPQRDKVLFLGLLSYESKLALKSEDLNVILKCLNMKIGIDVKCCDERCP